MSWETSGKEKSFGSASVMQLYKLVASIALFTGCVAQADTEQSITAWVEKTDKCVAMTE